MPTALPKVSKIWVAGLPETLFRRTMLPLAFAAIQIPFVLPPIMFLSITLPLLVPTRPIPKDLLTALSAGLTEPFPLSTFNRTRLLLLLASQVPPQVNPAEARFRTETVCSMSE